MAILQPPKPQPIPVKPPAGTETVPVEPKALNNLQAFSVQRVPGGWSFVTVNYLGDGTLLSVEKSQTDVKPIILERFKIAALRYWTSQ